MMLNATKASGKMMRKAESMEAILSLLMQERGSGRIGTGNTVFIRIVANFEMLTTSLYIDNGTISGLNHYPDNFTK